MSNNELTELIESYLNGEMTKEERANFDILRSEKPEVNDAFAEHKQFNSLIKQYGERLELEKRLNAIHSEIDVHALEEELMIHPSWVIRMWRNHHSKISVAASIAIFAVIGTLFFTGYLSNREVNYMKLSREVAHIKKSTDQLHQQVISLNPQHPGNLNPWQIPGNRFRNFIQWVYRYRLSCHQRRRFGICAKRGWKVI